MRSRSCLVLCTLLALVACTEDDPGPPMTAFSGTLVVVADETPMAGVEVTLFEPLANVTLASAVTDEAGHFAFEDLVPATVIPVVHSTFYRPVFLPRSRWELRRGDRIHVTLRMRRVTGLVGPADVTVRGRVLDEDTLEPIAKARVEMNFLANGEVAEVNWSEYTGWSSDLETTTDAEGWFELHPVPVFFDPLTERTNTPDARIVAPGYRAGRLPRLKDPDPGDTLLKGVRLTPGEDTGVIRGRVLDPAGQPLAGVPVSAEWRRIDNLLREFVPAELDHASRILIPGADARTDEEGRFEISRLPDGYFTVLAGPYPDDGFVGVEYRSAEVGGTGGPVEIELQGFLAISPTGPADGVILEDLPERLTWVSVANAAGYGMRLTRARDGARIYPTTAEPFFDPSVRPDFFDGPGSYAWEVLAQDADGVGISRTDRPLIFHVVDPQGRR